ncbi:MAG: PEP-CTERM sorting domain-containing protein [Planctomycetota bacterium]
MQAGTLEIELGGLVRGTEFDAVNVSGAALLNGVIDVNYINGFTTSLGDEFDIFDGTVDPSSTVSFDFTDAPLGAGLRWDTSQFLSNGVITAVPEPGTITLVGAIGLALAMRRSRKR